MDKANLSRRAMLAGTTAALARPEAAVPAPTAVTAGPHPEAAFPDLSSRDIDGLLSLFDAERAVEDALLFVMEQPRCYGDAGEVILARWIACHHEQDRIFAATARYEPSCKTEARRKAELLIRRALRHNRWDDALIALSETIAAEAAHG